MADHRLYGDRTPTARLLTLGAALLLAAGVIIAVALPARAARTYPAHTGIVSTTFWVGEIFNANAADGSQVCSTYDGQWALHWSGVDNGAKAGSGTDCAGAPLGGCDGAPSGTGLAFQCTTQKRTSINGYFPTSPGVSPKENPFYLDLPFDDVNDSTAFNERGTVIPWAADPGFAGNTTNGSFSYMKNRWVRLSKGGATCYAQIEDAGPGKYHDANYVFGAADAQPASTQYNHAGMDVSPAVNGCLGFAELDGDSDVVGWSFADAAEVPAGPWTQVVTTSQVDGAAPTVAYRAAITPGSTPVTTVTSTSTAASSSITPISTPTTSTVTTPSGSNTTSIVTTPTGTSTVSTLVSTTATTVPSTTPLPPTTISTSTASSGPVTVTITITRTVTATATTTVTTTVTRRR